MRCLKNGNERMGYERRRVFIQGASKPSHPLACRSNGEGSSPSSSDTDSDLPRFDVNPGTRTQCVANFIDFFEPSTAIRDGKYHAVTHLQDTFPSFVGRSPVLYKAVTALSAAFLAKAKETTIANVQYKTIWLGAAYRPWSDSFRAQVWPGLAFCHCDLSNI
jgi:hypothetical protein